jgi:PAS domain S-box-containing protein
VTGEIRSSGLAGLTVPDPEESPETREREELRARLAELSAMYRLADAVAGARTLDEVLNEAIAAISEALGTSRASILLADDGGVMRFRAWRGLSGEYRAATEGHSPWPADADDPQPVLVPDVDEADFEPELRDTIAREGIRALAFVPLVHQGRLLGKFMLYRDEPHEFSPSEIRLCQTLASHLASSTVRTRAQHALRDSQNQLEVIVRTLGEGVLATAPDGRLLFANEAAARLIGYDSPAELLASSWEERLSAFEVFDEERRPLAQSGLPGSAALRGLEAPDRLLCWRIKSTGEERWSTVRSSPVLAADGSVEFAITVFQDVTARKLAEDRTRFFSEASEVLASSLDYETTLRTVADLAVPRFADWCVIALLRQDGKVERAAVRHADAERTRAAEELAARIPFDPDAPAGPALAIRTGTSQLVPDVPPELIEETTRGRPEMRERLLEIAPRSAMAVPLLSGGRTLGAITFISAESGRRFGEDDLAAAEDLASRVATAVENALLYRDAQSARARLEILAAASETLGASLDLDRTLRSLADLTVPTLAGQCIVDLVDDGGVSRCVAAVHVDQTKTDLLRQTRELYPPVVPDHPVQRAIATGEPQFLAGLDEDAIAAMAHDEEHARVIREFENTSGIVVPLVARGRTLGTITLGTVPPQAPYTADDVDLAVELARRAAVAVDNALLYRAAEERAHAAQALQFVADGVFLVDEDQIVRLWNPAAEAITGVSAKSAVALPIEAVLTGWAGVRERIPLAPSPRTRLVGAHTLPIELGGRERWLSISGVRFPGGTVYAFRDLTEERAVERLKSDFVSTVSHELRTPLAAIYGAAVTLRRADLQLEEGQRTSLLDVVAHESDRLARIVNDILWASRLDSGTVSLEIESCDAGALAQQVREAAEQYAPPEIELVLDVPEGLPPIAADRDKTSQVLTNLLENAIKYSPDGGRVALALEARSDRLRFRVVDSGLGIPSSEQERIFEKFYRLDPNLTRGVGGTGLGLYICKELVQRMNGSIWVESDGRTGSTFVVELPLEMREAAEAASRDVPSPGAV